MLFIGKVLQVSCCWIGTVAIDQHAFAGVKQKGSGDILACQGIEGDSVGMQGFEQIGSNGTGAVQIPMLEINDERKIIGQKFTHFEHQLHTC